MEEHALDTYFGWGFHDRYVEYIKALPLGASVEWTQRLLCLRCGTIVGFPIMHKNWHKRQEA